MTAISDDKQTPYPSPLPTEKAPRFYNLRGRSIVFRSLGNVLNDKHTRVNISYVIY